MMLIAPSMTQSRAVEKEIFNSLLAVAQRTQKEFFT